MEKNIFQDQTKKEYVLMKEERDEIKAKRRTWNMSWRETEKEEKSTELNVVSGQVKSKPGLCRQGAPADH